MEAGYTGENKMKKFMNALNRWASGHHPQWIDSVRMGLGFLIHLKTLLFINSTASLIRVEEIHHFGWSDKWLVYITSTISLTTATFLILGLRTRVMTAFLFPSILASVIFSLVCIRGFYLSFECILSIVILLLLVLFFAEGSGKFSVDEYIKNNYKTLLTQKNSGKD